MPSSSSSQAAVGVEEAQRIKDMEIEIRRLLGENRSMRVDLSTIVNNRRTPVSASNEDASTRNVEPNLGLTGHHMDHRVPVSRVPRSSSDRTTQSQVDARRRLALVEQRKREVAAQSAEERRQLLPLLKWRDEAEADLGAS